MKRRLLVLSLLLASALVHAQERIKDVIYYKNGGAAFTMDVFKPKTANGRALIWLVSGGWSSSHEGIDPNIAKLFNDQGITVFEVVHGAQPRYQIPDIIKQVTRAVRFIRFNSTTYGIESNSISVSGASSGGHLTLMLAGLGDSGNADATDPVEKTSSKINAAVAFMPPTDFLNWGGDGVLPFKNPMLAIFMPAFGVNGQTPEDKMKQIGHDLSPIVYVKTGYPPTLLVHGDKDPLVPLQQSQKMDAALAAAGIDHKLVVVPGGGHDGKTLAGGGADMFAWLHAHLPGNKAS